MSANAQLQNKTKLVTLLIGFFLFSTAFSPVNSYSLRPSIPTRQELVIRNSSRRKLVSYGARYKSSISHFVLATKDAIVWFKFFLFNFEIKISEQFRQANTIIDSQVSHFIFLLNPRVYSLDSDDYHC